MEGESTLIECKHFWSKKQEIRQKIYGRGYIEGICDEQDVEKEVEKLLQKELQKSGWGKDFSGWQRIMSYEECLEIAEERGWQKPLIPTGKVKIEYVHNWTMEKILKTLTGEQFMQFYKDNTILKDWEDYVRVL
jgi:hypothetical protein